MVFHPTFASVNYKYLTTDRDLLNILVEPKMFLRSDSKHFLRESRETKTKIISQSEKRDYHKEPMRVQSENE